MECAICDRCTPEAKRSFDCVVLSLGQFLSLIVVVVDVVVVYAPSVC